MKAGAALLIAALAGSACAAPQRWQPLARALEPLGPLVIDGDALQWSICKGTTARALDGGRGWALEGQPGCVLDGRRLTHLSIVPRSGGCRAELSVYLSEADYAAGQPEARGLVEREGCR